MYVIHIYFHFIASSLKHPSKKTYWSVPFFVLLNAQYFVACWCKLSTSISEPFWLTKYVKSKLEVTQQFISKLRTSILPKYTISIHDSQLISWISNSLNRFCRKFMQNNHPIEIDCSMKIERLPNHFIATQKLNVITSYLSDFVNSLDDFLNF